MKILIVTVSSLVLAVVTVATWNAFPGSLDPRPQAASPQPTSAASSERVAALDLPAEGARFAGGDGEPDAEGDAERSARAAGRPTLESIETLATPEGTKRIAQLRHPDGSSVAVELKPTPPPRTADLPEGAVLEDGVLKVFHSSGRLAEKGPYVAGVKQGEWCYWSEEGTRELEGAYLDGLAEGLWRQWHDSGLLAAIGTASQGRFEGQCSFWHADGTPDMERTGWYEAGEKVR